MARLPDHITAQIAIRVDYGQAGIWATIRKLRSFTVGDIKTCVCAHATTITGYVQRLELGGYIRLIGVPGKWELVIDQPEAPRLRPDGSPCKEQGRGQENLWRSMKMLGDFDAAELARAAACDGVAVAVNTANTYLLRLYHAGYLLVVAPSQPGGRGRTPTKARYALDPRRNSGPLAPRIMATKAVYDPNNQQIYGLDEPAEEVLR